MAEFAASDLDKSGEALLDRPVPMPVDEITAIRERILMAQSADIFDVMGMATSLRPTA